MANDSPSDFALFQLIENPYDYNVNLYYNGWDRQTPTGSGVGIHHPWGDIKKISTYTNSPTDQPLQGFSWIYHWGVSWISTTHGFSRILPGSSGSPLYNTEKRVIGQCHYGVLLNASSCISQNAFYGKFSVSWNHNNIPQRQLAYWLDPLNLNPLYTDGSYCFTNSISNKTYTSDATETGCSISATNITIPSGINVIYDAVNSTTLNGPFQVNLGASLEIK